MRLRLDPRCRVFAQAGAAVAALSLVLLYAFDVFPRVHPTVPERTASALKAAIALATLGLTAYDARRRRSRTPLDARKVRVALVGLAALSVAGYLNFGDLGYPRVYHRWEFFHYYLGAKYHEELGYTRLYAATAVAESQLGPAFAEEVAHRSLRNLTTDAIEPTETVLAHAGDYEGRFSSARWAAFRSDVAWFRSVCDAGWWAKMQRDHGYNPAPLWTVEGSFFARAGPASDGTLRLLATLDLALFAGAFFAVGWAFGLRTLCVTLVFWGAQWPANFTFTWGAFLRQDWLFYLLLAVALAKRRRYGLAGASLAASALVRVFPALLAIPVVAGAVFGLRRRGRVPGAHARFLRGFAVGGASLLALSLAVLGPRAHAEFASHLATHSRAAMTNLMGLKTIAVFDWRSAAGAAFDPDALDSFARWGELRAARAEALRPLLLILSAASVAGVAWASRGPRSVWKLLPCGLLLVMAAAELTNYYYSVFLLAPLLSSDRRDGSAHEAASLAAAAFSALLVTWTWMSSSLDTRCYAQSGLFLILAVFVVVRADRASSPFG